MNAPRGQEVGWPYQSDSVFKVFGILANRNDISYVMFRGYKVWLNGEPQYADYYQQYQDPYYQEQYQYPQTNYAMGQDPYVGPYYEHTPDSSAEATYDRFNNWYSQGYM